MAIPAPNPAPRDRRTDSRRAVLRAALTAAAVIASLDSVDEARAQASYSSEVRPYRSTAAWSPNRYLPGAQIQPSGEPFDSIGRRRETVELTPPSSGASLTAAEVLIEEPDGNGGVRTRPSRGIFEERPWAHDVFNDHDLKDWSVQWLPDGIIYRSYLAGSKEPRMSSVLSYDDNLGGLWDLTLGGRVGIFRFGTDDPIRPEGLQFDLEGAGMPQLRLDSDRDLEAVDFRGGFPLTYGIGPWATKVAYYHLSSHAGDEFLAKNPAFRRVNYSRDAFVIGQSYYFTPSLRLYGEAGWAFYSDVSEPWEFQFGADFSPLCPPGLRGAPFAAINGHLREEVDFGGNVVVQAGWQWRSAHNGQLLRMGLQYYDGKSNQYEFYNRNENKLGMGVWYDY